MMTDRVAPRSTKATRAKPKIRLAEVTADNWHDVIALELDDDQRDLVADNLYSLAEAKFTPLACPRAIYAGTELVGFLMYDLPDDDEPDHAAIYRFMIDRRHQRRGYGRAALERLLDELRAHPGIAAVSICYAAKNPARVLYQSLGFKEVERDVHGEIFAELSLTQ
jgi:diamine N-acetyltransferase